MKTRHDDPMRERRHGVIVVGSGLSGMTAALSLAPIDVALITKTPQLEGGSSVWAQGGIAAAVGRGDSVEMHTRDTLVAGAGLCDPERVAQLAGEGADAIQWLVDEGVPFDREPGGELALSKEAAHRVPRVVHAGGDSTGRVVVESLARRVMATPSVSVIDNTFACDLVVRGGAVQGVVTFNERDGWVFHRAPVVLLATGGIGMAWSETTNPPEATGDGLAMAARAGARLADLEFVQFHPTALALTGKSDGGKLPLLTEALRGAGALLLDESGHRFMLEEHPDAELAPRDVVARAMYAQVQRGHRVFLDLRPVFASRGDKGFPTVVGIARDAGFDPFAEPLPVMPAAHYHMGGVQVDEHGQTCVEGLLATGEVSATGVHGANRLASNSLLEAVVFARRAAAAIRGRNHAIVAEASAPARPGVGLGPSVSAIAVAARRIMSRDVGISRTGLGLGSALAQLTRMEQELFALAKPATAREGLAEVRAWGEACNILLIARLVSYAALQRTESRGAHYRRDFPAPNAAWRQPQLLSIDDLVFTPPAAVAGG